jgi:hypothetical protein
VRELLKRAWSEACPAETALVTANCRRAQQLLDEDAMER